MWKIILSGYVGSLVVEAFGLFLMGREVIGSKYKTYYYNQDLCNTIPNYKYYNRDLCDQTNEALQQRYYITSLSMYIWEHLHFCGGKECKVENAPSILFSITITIFFSIIYPTYIKKYIL